MRETRSSGSVEGVMSNRDPYSDLTVYDLQTSGTPRYMRMGIGRASPHDVGSSRLMHRGGSPEKEKCSCCKLHISRLSLTVLHIT